MRLIASLSFIPSFLVSAILISRPHGVGGVGAAFFGAFSTWEAEAQGASLPGLSA